MESWSYISDGKGLVSRNQAESSSSLVSTIGLVNWVSDQQQQDTGLSFEELGVPQLTRQQQQHLPNPMIGAMAAFSDDSNSIVKSSSRDSSLIDLKLGRFGDFKHHGSKFLQTQPILYSSELSVPAKRPRAGSMNSPAAAYCQVYGCNKDLSFSKDYHKRHKVCDVHSKTATVIVNGIQQRFCQQCSRFHLLAEFDDGKRSCRKRLAGHNERRRKHQGGAPTGRLPQPVNGTKPQASVFTPTSFICQDILPSGTRLPNPDVKAENLVDHGPFSAIPTIPNAHSRTLIPPYTFDKHFPFFHASSSSTLCPAGFSVFNTEISDPGCALSLLSSPSQNSSTYSSGFPMAGMAEPLPHQSGHTEQFLYGKEEGPVISTSQLSSQLQRIESQRQSLKTGQGHGGGFCCPRIA